jgi:hypothetical protein
MLTISSESLAGIKDLLHKNTSVLNSIVQRTRTLRVANPNMSLNPEPPTPGNFVSGFNRLSVGGMPVKPSQVGICMSASWYIQRYSSYF